MEISVHYDEGEQDYFATIDATGESWVVPASSCRAILLVAAVVCLIVIYGVWCFATILSAGCRDDDDEYLGWR